jgi:hypothetical protein
VKSKPRRAVSFKVAYTMGYPVADYRSASIVIALDAVMSWYFRTVEGRMSRSQTVSTVSSVECIIQSLNLSFVLDNLTCVCECKACSVLDALQRCATILPWLRMAATSPRTLVLPLHFEGQPRGVVLHLSVPPFTHHITRHVPKMSLDTPALTPSKRLSAKSSRVQLYLS